jgi:hypothetical protein
MHRTFWKLVSVSILVGGGMVAQPMFPHHTSAVAVGPAIAPVGSPPGYPSAGVAVTLDGVLVCLPQRDGRQEELTLACAVGLRTTDGRLYAMENINPYLMMGKAAMGQHVEVNGWSRPSTDPRFDAIGTIDITSVAIRDPSTPPVNQ